MTQDDSSSDRLRELELKCAACEPFHRDLNRVIHGGNGERGIVTRVHDVEVSMARMGTKVAIMSTIGALVGSGVVAWVVNWIH